MGPFFPYIKKEKRVEQPLLPLYEEAYIPFEYIDEQDKNKQEKKESIIIIELF